MGNVEIQSREIGDFVVLDIIGTAQDFGATKKLQQEIEAMLESRSTSVALNLSHMDYLHSGIIGLFVHWHRVQEQKGRQFCLIEPNEATRETLTLVGFDKLIPIYESEQMFRDTVLSE